MRAKEILDNILKDFPDDVAKITELGAVISTEVAEYLRSYCKLCVRHMNTEGDVRLLLGSIVAVLLTIVSGVIESFPDEFRKHMLETFNEGLKKLLGEV